ncbi:MAG: ABC transporter ATP-binding protein [Ilumatobacter sp.]|nr:ABC transporter ATP-binding protein [Ilumatobacter sp.]
MKLDIERLTIRYEQGGHTVEPITDLDLIVESGEFALLHGPSGCGKTSLLSAVAGLLTPAAGAIRLDGDDVAALSGPALMRHRQTRVGVVFQAFNLLPALSAVDNVTVPLLLAGRSRRDAARRARDLLTELGMEHRLEHRPAAMSGGQQQRVAIARALATDAPVILADEPTAHLDRDQVDVVRGLLRGIADDGRIVLVSTHDDRLEPSADRTIRL